MKIIFVSSCLPRECGIATFSADLISSLKEIEPNLECEVVAIGDRKYKYGKIVRHEIDQHRPGSFLAAAKYINKSNANLVNIQHQFQLFGNEGRYTELFIKNIKKPVITTLHSVLDQPTETQKRATRSILKYSAGITVMIKYARNLLEKLYGAKREKITVIPHPIPSLLLNPIKRAKEKLNLKEKIVISSFGLVRWQKGLEYVLQALPEIIKDYPRLIYLIIGKTHSADVQEGKSYGEYLINLKEKLGLQKYVRSINQFVSIKKLGDYLGATDIYITPYLDRRQVSSGALTFALGMGKACISTPYPYAQEVLSQKRGLLVKYADPSSISRAIKRILENKALKKDMEERAFRYGQNLSWPKQAGNYLNLFKRRCQ